MRPACRSRLDLVVAVDASSSVDGSLGFQRMLDLVRLTASMIGISPAGGGRLALLSFADTVDFRFHLDKLSSFLDVADAIGMDYA